jgi:hypothetical protein
MIARPSHTSSSVHPARAARRTGALARPAGLAVLVGGFLGACLSVPAGPKPECQTSDDCDRAHGEVCEENVCWGNPPAGPFAAVISPPTSRRDLVSREIPQVVIPDFGWMGDLALEEPVLLSGKVVAACASQSVPCDPTPIAATVTVSRRAQFQGGPGFKAVANADAGDAFAIPVPRSHAGDDPYTVIIVPDGTQKPGVRSAAELVPPRRLQVSVSDNIVAAPVPLGGANLAVISGRLTDNLDEGLAGYRVAALGRWDPTAPATEVSTIAYTDAQGAYAVTLSDALAGPVEIVARPVPAKVGDPPPTATIHISNIATTASAQLPVVALPDSLGAPVTVDLTVQGPDLGGTIKAVAGAHVSVAGSLPGSLTSPLTTFTMGDDEVADDNGHVQLHLLNGAGIASSYRLAITPPGGSTLGVVFDQKVAPLTGLTSYAPPPIRLVTRIELSGRVVFGPDDQPLGNVSVTARPSLRFLWALDAAPQAFVAAIPAATAMTDPGTGVFVLWVDPNIPNVAQSWGDYDLLIDPPMSAAAPTVVTEFAIPRSSVLDAATVPSIALPDPARIHGRITGPDGKPVDKAELKLYRISTQLTLCSELAHAPASCPIPADLLDRNTSDSDGTVRLVLPRP